MALWETIPDETPIDPSGLKVKGITNREQLNSFEAENIRKAMAKYLARKPTRRTARFDLSWAMRLHREMFGNVWEWAGSFRTEDKNLGIHWHQVETSLQALLDDLACWGQYGMEVLEQVARLHHRAVHIHPFENGNGRWSRLLANIWLKRHGHPPTAWPEEVIGTVSVIRDEYITAIKKADEGDYEPLMELHRRYTV